MNSGFNTHASQSQPFNYWDQTPQYAPTPGFLACSPSFLSVHGELSSPVVQPCSNILDILKLSNWEEGMPYDNDPPTCIHYSIEWKVTVNNWVVAKDTEPDLVLTPSACLSWGMNLDALHLLSSLCKYCPRLPLPPSFIF